MSRMPWFRMFSEARNDAKLRRLDDSQFRVWFNLLCVASEQDDRGEVIECNAFLLAVETCNADATLLKRTCNDLALLRIADVRWETSEDGEEVVSVRFLGWDKRQYDKPSDKPEAVAQRVKRHRETKRNADVTPRNAQEKIREEEKREEESRETPPLPPAAELPQAPATASPPRKSKATPPEQRQPRPRSPLFDAVMTACGYDLTAPLTTGEGGKIGAATTEIGNAGGTVPEIAVRAVRYRKKFPNASLTPPALANHWGELAVEPERPGGFGRASPEQKTDATRAALMEFYAQDEETTDGQKALRATAR